MALRPDREYIQTDITYTCESAAEAGSVVALSTAGSGAAIGATRAEGDVFATVPSGKVPLGILLHDVESVTLTRYAPNFQKLVTQPGDPCTILTKGWVVTNKISGSPTAGATAYLVASGLLSPTVHGGGGTAASPKVGRFESVKDELGYARVSVNLPIV